MIEPWERDWTGLADWGDLPRMEPTIPALLAHSMASHPGRAAFVLDEAITTYADLDAQSARFAAQLLAAGIGKGGRVGIMLPNDASFLISWMGAARIGAIAVTIPSLAKSGELAKLASHADLQLLVAPRAYLHHDYADRISEALPGFSGKPRRSPMPSTPYLKGIWLWCDESQDCPQWARRIELAPISAEEASVLAGAEAAVNSSDAAGIIYTSGSTAEPKGVIHSHGSFIRSALKLAASFGYGPGERAFASMPFFWVGGLTTTAMCLLAAGGTILASRRTGAALLDFIEGQRTTAVVSWPHIMRGLADDPSFAGRDWGAMRNGLFYETLPAGRKPSDPTLLATPIGMTETNGPYTIVDRHLTEDQRGSLGRLMPGVAARLLDPDSGELIGHWAGGDLLADSAGRVGVLHLRSDTMMLGMVKREHADVFTADGWYDSCDLVAFRRGHVHYHGRADGLIKAHGANVSPREVEQVIAQFPGVSAVHAVGVPDAVRGAVVGAVVVAEPGRSLDPAEIRNAAALVLASYKVPRIIKVCSLGDLPVLPSSKVDRRGLVTMLQGEPHLS
jgi:acyl-CoA synthetase (AMP-forming)/AMP-acid ligase II